MNKKYFNIIILSALLITPVCLFSQEENKLAVVITSISPTEENPLEINGYFIYESKDKKIREEINKNAWGISKEITF